MKALSISAIVSIFLAGLMSCGQQTQSSPPKTDRSAVLPRLEHLRNESKEDAMFVYTMIAYHLYLAKKITEGCPKYKLRLSEDDYLRYIRSEMASSGITMAEYRKFLDEQNVEVMKFTFAEEAKKMGVIATDNPNICDLGDRAFEIDSGAGFFLEKV